MTPVLVGMLGPFVFGGFVVLLVDRQFLSWFAGLISGVCAGVWIWVRESPPRYVEQWQDGAEGERKTEKALRPLERAEWTVIHDIQERHGNYDHVAVGPAGVYLFETKNLQGIVEVRDGITHLKRRHDADTVAHFEGIRAQALGAAARIKDEIEQHTGQRIWVQAVVVFWSEFPDQLVEDDRCVYIHGSGLRTWLREREAQLDERQVEDIAGVLERLGHKRAK